MLNRLELNGNWKLRGCDCVHGSPSLYTGVTVDERTFIDAQVPGEVHLDLQNAGQMKDCLSGVNAREAAWVENSFWVYRRKFDATADAVSARRAWLVFDGLDLHAKIYFNGEEIGQHFNFFTPCRLDVTGKLLEGENVIAVRVDGGAYAAADKPTTPYTLFENDATTKRIWLRKPQCQFSWDWNPRLVNVGIWKPVKLEWTDTARIDALIVFPELADDHKSAKLKVKAVIDSALPAGTQAVIWIKIPEARAGSEYEVVLPEGESSWEMTVDIENPRLWWPRGHGDQPLYKVECELIIDGETADSTTRRTGIRGIRIDQDPHPEKGNYFVLEVNGVPIFAKGGNLVPADVIFARVDAQRYKELVKMAVGANFNLLRLWGGGLYADHALLDACDEMGIMVWHDFIFACAKFPVDDLEFLGNVRNEIRYNVRDLSPHPSLVVWCGNNEMEWGYWAWPQNMPKLYSDFPLFHLEIPRILAAEDPSRPYWPSSPYSAPSIHPQEPTVGDQHPWNVTIMGDGANFHAYRNDISRFADEGGVLGASCPATLREFLPEDQRYLFSPSWEFHDNAVNFMRPRGVCYETVEHWTGFVPEEMSMDDYAFYSALLQGEGLKEYSDNYRRRMFDSAAAVFWMYNDAWPATHGWTIIDYYMRRKGAYHPVRRAFRPVHVIPVAQDGRVEIYGVNDTMDEWRGEVRYGIFAVKGGLPLDMREEAVLAPNSRTLLADLDMNEWRKTGLDSSGVFAALYGDGVMETWNRIFTASFKDLGLEEANVKVERHGDYAVFSSDVFVWGVCLDPNGEQDISDDFFDLIPSIEYSIPWPTDKPLPVVVKTGNDGERR